MPNLPSKLMIITYRAGTPSDVLAEFADDKIRFSEKFRMKTFVITALGTNLLENESLRIFRVPSISKRDFSLEIELLRNNNLPQPKWIKFYKVIPLTIGRSFDSFYKLVNGEFGYARWSWSINAIIVGVYVKFFFSVKHCLAIGGASAYLVELILRISTRIRLYIEIPDPIIGSEMIRSSKKNYLLKKLEEKLIKNSIKCLFITTQSYLEAVNRHPKLRKRIFFHYPEAWDFQVAAKRNREDQIKIVHLGSIYDNRNLDNLFLALDGLYEEKILIPGEIQILNIGVSKCVNSAYYLKRVDYKLVDPQPRRIALEIAASVDYLLLLQHTDSRSCETIPYKFYDYLNLRIPIIALINNLEINEILANHGGSLIADVNDVESIQNLVRRIKTTYSTEVDKELPCSQNGQNFASIFT